MTDIEKRSSKAMLLRFIAVLYGIGVCVFAYVIYLDISMTGFPDGHLTEYERAAKLPLTIGNWLNLLFGLYFFYSAWRYSAKTPKRVYIAIFLHLFLFALMNYGIKYYFINYQGLDYGQGG